MGSSIRTCHTERGAGKKAGNTVVDVVVPLAQVRGSIAGEAVHATDGAWNWELELVGSWREGETRRSGLERAHQTWQSGRRSW